MIAVLGLFPTAVSVACPGANPPVIMDYVGAYPAGTPAPDLASVPIDPNVDFYFALSFARDIERDGTFRPVWDDKITPERILQLKGENSRRKFLVSLGGGDNWPWQDPADPNAWVTNAVRSLGQLIDQYHLDGVDINYEPNVNAGAFVDAMGQVIAALKQQRPTLIVTVTPFRDTWNVYQALYRRSGKNIDWINYQAYADFTMPAEYIDGMGSIANQLGGDYGKLALGIATSTREPRGLQPPGIYDVVTQLCSKGLRGVQIWSLEDSAPGYEIERRVSEILTHPAGSAAPASPQPTTPSKERPEKPDKCGSGKRPIC